MIDDGHSYAVQTPQARLRLWVLGQMLWGAGISSVIVIGIGVLLGAIWAVGEFLPERSKEAPSPYGAIEIVRTIEVA